MNEKNFCTGRFSGNLRKDIEVLQKAWVTFNGFSASLETTRGGDGVDRSEMGMARRRHCPSISSVLGYVFGQLA
jgi:hypothetical protein